MKKIRWLAAPLFIHPSIHPSLSFIPFLSAFSIHTPYNSIKNDWQPLQAQAVNYDNACLFICFYPAWHRQYLEAQLKIRAHNVCSVSLLRLALLYGWFHITTCVWAPSRFCEQTFSGLLSNITDLSFSVFTLIRRTVGLSWNWSEAKTSRYRLG